MPLSPVVQPVMWSHSDVLHLHPEPDYLVLADEFESYDLKVPIADERVIHVLSPGVFKNNGSFYAIYPEQERVEYSKTE